MIKIPFVKMVGAGNDFIVIEPQANLDYVKFTQQICPRQTGLGADGVLILEKSKTSDYRMRIINADGSEAEMCGNGARCMAAYIVAQHKPTKKPFGMETLAGEVLAEFVERMFLLAGIAMRLWTAIAYSVEQREPKVRLKCRQKGAR